MCPLFEYVSTNVLTALVSTFVLTCSNRGMPLESGNCRPGNGDGRASPHLKRMMPLEGSASPGGARRDVSLFEAIPLERRVSPRNFSDHRTTNAHSAGRTRRPHRSANRTTNAEAAGTTRRLERRASSRDFSDKRTNAEAAGRTRRRPHRSTARSRPAAGAQGTSDIPLFEDVSTNVLTALVSTFVLTHSTTGIPLEGRSARSPQVVSTATTRGNTAAAREARRDAPLSRCRPHRSAARSRPPAGAQGTTGGDANRGAPRAAPLFEYVSTNVLTALVSTFVLTYSNRGMPLESAPNSLGSRDSLGSADRTRDVRQVSDWPTLREQEVMRAPRQRGAPGTSSRLRRRRHWRARPAPA